MRIILWIATIFSAFACTLVLVLRLKEVISPLQTMAAFFFAAQSLLFWLVATIAHSAFVEVGVSLSQAMDGATTVYTTTPAPKAN